MDGVVANATPISVWDWVRSACKLPSIGSYVESAVHLALVLTKHIDHSFATSALKLEDQITAENIIIFVERPPLTTGYVPSIIGVKFRFTSGFSLLSAVRHADGSAQQSCPRAVCAALGKILLEIFSMGRASSLEQGIANSSASACAQNSRAGKRQATMPTSGSVSDVAKQLLLSLGMPVAICQLVGDLLDSTNEACSNSSLTSLREALWDVAQMKANPQTFLFDRLSPQQALADTSLFNNTDTHVVGRERETHALMTAKNNVSAHVRTGSNSNGQVFSEGMNFLFEAAFLGGYAGSGKSTLMHSVIHACNREQWFVLGCKCDKQSAPHIILAKAFNDFFGKWGISNDDTRSDLNQAMIVSFHKVCRRIFLTMDDEGLRHLCDLVPNFALIFPLLNLRSKSQDQDGISSMDKIGSAKNRLQQLFNVLFKSLCSCGRPVLFTIDDLQWSRTASLSAVVTKESFAIDDMISSAVNYIHDTTGDVDERCRRGLLIVGTFRSNEVDERNITKRINAMKESGRAHVATLAICELSKVDITNLISSKLCLPRRYTKELAELVYSKTRGNPFFVIQFLKSIMRNNMLSFSVKFRRWTWDCDVVELQMISDGVAQLLTTTFNQLPLTLMQTVKIISCLGSQVDKSVIDALDSRNGILSFNMQTELSLAVKEGILEKAGPVYQFVHDILHQTIYELIPSQLRKLLHKRIGENLLKSADVVSPTILLLGVDQINIYCKDGALDSEERSQFTNSNAVAAKFAIQSLSFEQARLYIKMGIQLLETQNWKTQYHLSLDLFEMSASVSCMHGDIATMTDCLEEILSRVRVFGDSLKALSLLIKLLASSSKFEEARSNCLMALESLGEEFPREVNYHLVQNELCLMQNTLKNITSKQIKLLPRMTDKNKLNAMKFLNMLCQYSNISKPMMLPLLSWRMVTLTMKYGFCDDSIIGLATAGHSLLLFAEDIQLATHLGKISESLIGESSNRHMLRTRLCNELVSSIKLFVEPSGLVLPLYLELYHSAMMVGDIENAMICRWSYDSMEFWTAASSLFSLSNHLVNCIKEATKYQQHTVLYSAMSNLNVCVYLSGETNIAADMKSFDELDQIGEVTKSAFLVFQNFNHRLALHFWMRGYLDVAILSETFSKKHPSSQQNRILNVFRTFYEGIAHLNLARDTKQAKWKVLGKNAVTWMSALAARSKWNFENKSKLLQAELHYLEGDLASAEAAYKASIDSAREQKYHHEEALACELYGICCVENCLADQGSEQLHNALNLYRQWGAMRKVAELQQFIEIVDAKITF